jgi:Zn-dependent peptidase ImmA (M78 family)
MEAEDTHLRLPHIVGKTPPFEIYPLIQHYALELAEWDLADEIAGCIMRKGDTYCIGVNRRHPLTRRRFSAAHELYHYLEHRHLLTDSTWFSARASADELPEREANRFAAELLIPAIWFKYYVRFGSMRYLADTFGVSRPAVARRMQELAIFVKLGR